MAEATNQLRVRLVTPERTLFEVMAESVDLPSKSGYLEPLYGHAPLMAELGAGDVTLHGGDANGQRYFVSWGFAEVLPERVTILANDALRPAEIDVRRAQEQLDRGERLWKGAGDSEEAYDEALRVIAEAEAKIASAGGAARKH
ncbi:MAG TPA: ATP synthase F1 subunit epsilon [Terracidiphilus sp.]|nr:ATP synthase F1 subunit epsilon [Terracidiphilus sp.]